MASPQRKYGTDDVNNRAADRAGDAEVLAIPVNEANTMNSSSSVQRIGDILKRERERRGYDLQQIADYLCIRRGLLVALENSRYEEFPADAYVIGFLRSYAELIGLNGQDAIDLYRQEMAGRRKKPDLVMPTPVSEGRAPTPVIIGIAALASLFLYILWYAFSTSDRATVTTPPALPAAALQTTIDAPAATVPPATTGEATVTAADVATPVTSLAQTTTPASTVLPSSTPSGIAIGAPAPAQQALTAPTPASTASSTPTADTPASATAAATATQAAPASSAAAAAHIVIRAEQSSWVLVSNAKGQTIYDHVMKPGETYQVPSLSGLSLTTGNGAGIVIVLDGADLPRLSSTTSHIVRNVSLETAALKAYQPQ